MPSQVDQPAAVGRRLRAARLARGLTQLEASRILGVAQSCVSAYEEGKRLPDPGIWNQIAGLYRVSVESLFLRGAVGRPRRGLRERVASRGG